MHVYRISSIMIFAFALACARADTPPPQLSGVMLPEPIPRPDFTLTATDGLPYAFRERTAGTVTLLFFGYTNCPDVCPAHAANVAAVVRTLPWDDRQRVKFVFVTTDPDRDSLPVLRAWLAHFDSSFVGLRGPIKDVNAILLSLNLGPSFAEEPLPGGSGYGVAHPAVVVAFTPDDSARVMYPFGIRQEHWAADIPKLLAIGKR